MVPYVDAVVDVIVMRVLLFVLHVCMLREYMGARVTAMLVWGIGCGVVLVSAWHMTRYHAYGGPPLGHRWQRQWTTRYLSIWFSIGPSAADAIGIC